MSGLLRHLSFWLSLPLAALQGLGLRRTAFRLPEAGGARAGVCGEGAVLHLLALGDSIIAGVVAAQTGMLHIATDIKPFEDEFCADGFHPSAASCARWARVLAQKSEAANVVRPDPGKGFA